MRHVLWGAVGAVLLLAACTSDEAGPASESTTIQSSSTTSASTTSAVQLTSSSTIPSPLPVNAPPQEVSVNTIEPEPVNPVPGDSFTVRFARNNQRGGYFFMHPWLGDHWGEAYYLLESGAIGRSPSVSLVSEGWMLNDYGISGPGPDDLVLPPDIQAGYWRLCPEFADGNDFCTQLAVGLPVPVKPQSTADLVCEEDFDEIVELLRSEMSAHADEPAADVQELAQSSEAMLTGTIDSVVRASPIAGLTEHPTDIWTLISSRNAQPPMDWPDWSPIKAFYIDSAWAGPGDVDPLATEVTIDGLEYVAFLAKSETYPSEFVVRAQGLAVSCVGSSEAAVSIIHPLPADASGLSAAELADLIYSWFD